MIRDLTDLEQSKLAHAECPFCGSFELREGPHGGLAVNVICGTCKAVFNLGVFLVEQGRFWVGEVIEEPRALAPPSAEPTFPELEAPRFRPTVKRWRPA